MVDPLGKLGQYFCLHGLALRRTGKYRLNYQLVDIGEFFPNNDTTPSIRDGHVSETKESLFSAIFEVYHPKDFPGIVKSKIALKALYEI